MLTAADTFIRMAEVNTPDLPDSSHLLLEGAWDVSRKVTASAEDAGCAGVILMGLKFDTPVDETALAWTP